jgi:hypothetical protein
MRPLFLADRTEASGYALVSALFLKSLALIYFIAFASIGVQIDGLAGPDGILPLQLRLDYLSAHLGVERFWQLPTLFWIDASNTALVTVAVAGCGFAVLAVFNILLRTSLAACLVLYLSLYHAGQVFMNFQWDVLLMEAGFIALFLPGGSRAVVHLMRFLLFKLRFLSGVSKLISGDPAWADLTALRYYFEVQPLPNPLSWYAQHLPDWLLRLGAGGTLFVELIVPFMMFMPRRYRFIAAWLTILWQLLILLTANHNWANLLTIALCLFLFDDRALRRVLPAIGRDWLEKVPGPAAAPSAARRNTGLALAVSIVFVSAIGAFEMLAGREAPGPFALVLDRVRSFGIVNNYHVFPTMKAERLELEISGSVDGERWEVYRFKYKPGPVAERPRVVVPHAPRLDWHMWFITLNPRFMPSFESFLQALLENSTPVTDLLAHNPFPAEPPRYLRVELFRYRFTTPRERADTGDWWHRESLGPFPPLPWMERTWDPPRTEADEAP